MLPVRALLSTLKPLAPRAVAGAFYAGLGLIAYGAGPTPPSFASAAVPFLKKYCVECHGTEKQKADVALHLYTDDASVLKNRKQWKDILRVVDHHEMPPEEKQQPTPAERDAFEAAAKGVFERAANAAVVDPGRVVVRRLNKTEYNNTIRDLLGLDFRPADDFPADDIGYGFDNIGDVLSVSPVLMEQYLDAAERIAEATFPSKPPKVPVRKGGGKQLEPSTSNPPMQKNARIIDLAERVPFASGPLAFAVKTETPGDYILRVRVSMQKPTTRPARVVLLATGSPGGTPITDAQLQALGGQAAALYRSARVLKVEEVRTADEAKPQTIEVKFNATGPIERVAVGLVKPAPGEPEPSVLLFGMELEGPADYRSPELKRLLTFGTGKTPAERTRQILGYFMPRAWRRPIPPDELERVSRIVDGIVAQGESWEAGMQRAMAVILSSPKFVFRLEQDDQPDNPLPHPINEFQLATRLSFFLWSTGPDDELLRLALQRQLTPNLVTQVRRMLKDPKAAALMDNFGLQWLQLRRIAGHTADNDTFPRWRPSLRDAMLEETRRFLRTIHEEDRSVLDLINADFTWVDKRLAELYGIRGTENLGATEWRRVSLQGTGRVGLLTQASVLTVTSNPTRTSPVKRGKWILEQILGDPPPPAPPNVPSIDDDNRKELKGSFRQKLEQHRADPRCANCHAKMDAFGFAFEEFDGIGQRRALDETGSAIDVSGKLSDGREIKGVEGIRALLDKDKEQFTRSLAEKMLIYALGRGTEYYDDRALDKIQTQLAQGGYRFSSLVTAIALSDPFRLRRGKAQIGPASSN